jgi:hypothetical protein
MNIKFQTICELTVSLRCCCKAIEPGSELLIDQVTGRVISFDRDNLLRLQIKGSWERAIGFDFDTINLSKIIVVDCQDRHGNAWCHIYDIPGLKLTTLAEFQDQFCWIDC